MRVRVKMPFEGAQIVRPPYNTQIPVSAVQSCEGCIWRRVTLGGLRRRASGARKMTSWAGQKRRRRADFLQTVDWLLNLTATADAPRRTRSQGTVTSRQAVPPPDSGTYFRTESSTSPTLSVLPPPLELAHYLLDVSEGRLTVVVERRHSTGEIHLARYPLRE
jgi:hypothetical protein